MTIGMTIVSISYFLVNLSFFSILSNDEIVGTQAVALVSVGPDSVYHSRQGCIAVVILLLQPFGVAVMGRAGLIVIPLLVAISTFGSNVLTMFIASR